MNQEKITIQALNSALQQQAYPHKLKTTQPQDELATGQLAFARLASGIHVHFADTLEQQNATSTVNLSACLSLTILLSGKLSYSIDDRQYHFATEKGKPLLIINLFTEQATFTRYLIKNQRVTKLNLMVTAPWLIERSHNKFEQQQLNALFNQHSQVIHQPCPEALVSLAQHYTCAKKHSLSQQIQLEMHSLKIIEKGMTLLLTNNTAAVFSAPKNKPLVNHEKEKLAKQLAKWVEGKADLTQMAASLGLSISSLQRKIKQEYNKTAVEYVRQKRLEQACQNLILNDRSIGEVAYQAGYRHVANFVTAFKKQYHLTPAQFRKQHA